MELRMELDVVDYDQGEQDIHVVVTADVPPEAGPFSGSDMADILMPVIAMSESQEITSQRFYQMLEVQHEALTDRS